MLRVLTSGIWAAANALLSPNQNQPTTSRWSAIRNFLYSALSNIGIPLIRSMTANEAVYECVNTLLANPTTTTVTRNHNENHSNLSRHSRPNFRRRTHHHHGGNIRIINPTYHIHIH